VKRALFLLGLLALVGCGEETSSSLGRAGVAQGLVFERADGSRIEMRGRPLVWCGPWNDEIPDTALQIAAVGGIERKPGEKWFSYWQLWAVPEDIEGQAAVVFPGNYTFYDPSGVVLFVGDLETKNEASSKGEDSSGQIVFTQASCEVGAPIEFTIDAVVDSEFGDREPVTVTGTFRGVVGEPPARWSG
jgi:hypothetical protein